MLEISKRAKRIGHRNIINQTRTKLPQKVVATRTAKSNAYNLQLLTEKSTWKHITYTNSLAISVISVAY